MAIWSFACGVFLFIQGFAAYNNYGDILLVMTMLFLCSFEFAPGPIVWLYLGEIMNDKGLSIGVFVNWCFALLVGLLTPTLMDPNNLGPSGTFYLFGVCNIIAVVYILLFMKETKGLTDLEAKNLYRKDKIKFE